MLKRNNIQSFVNYLFEVNFSWKFVFFEWKFLWIIYIWCDWELVPGCMELLNNIQCKHFDMNWIRQNISSIACYHVIVWNCSLHIPPQCVASIAAAEFPQNQWPELLPSLVSSVENAQSSYQLKEASLEAIGYMCQDIVSMCLQNCVENENHSIF